jgi:threonine dehydrogenase-like Zn-dependent dehydrogenase
VTVFGLGPIGQMSSRIAKHRGARVIGVDLVPERLEMARRHGIEVLDVSSNGGVAAEVRELTNGRGTDSVIDAVGMEAHGSSITKAAQTLVGMLPDAVARAAMEHAGVDRLAVFNSAIETVRRAGTVSLSGVYGGTADPVNLLQAFDKGINIRMGQAHVKRWIDDLMPLVTDDSDPLGVEDLATHQLPLEEAPRGYEIFQKKEDNAIKVVLKP